MKSSMALGGVVLAAAGFVGSYLSKAYFREHLGADIKTNFLDAIGAQQHISFQDQLANFFAQYGFYVGLTGLVLIVLALVLGRR